MMPNKGKQLKSVLVLGSTGMLGSMVNSYLKLNPELNVKCTIRSNFDVEKFIRNEAQSADLKCEYIVNCIGVIKPYCREGDSVGARKAIVANALFPHVLGQFAKKNDAKVIHIATDCVYSGNKGQYIETDLHDASDTYGKSKSLGEVFDGTVLNVRCSVIGPELQNHKSLFDWFLRTNDGTEVNGYAHHDWNGVTTLQFAKLCEKIITSDSLYTDLLSLSHVHHFAPNSQVNKYELLCLMAEVFNKNISIKKVDNLGGPANYTLATQYSILNKIYPPMKMKSALVELQEYIHKR